MAGHGCLCIELFRWKVRGYANETSNFPDRNISSSAAASRHGHITLFFFSRDAYRSFVAGLNSKRTQLRERNQIKGRETWVLNRIRCKSDFACPCRLCPETSDNKHQLGATRPQGWPASVCLLPGPREPIFTFQKVSSCVRLATLSATFKRVILPLRKLD